MLATRIPKEKGCYQKRRQELHTDTQNVEYYKWKTGFTVKEENFHIQKHTSLRCSSQDCAVVEEWGLKVRHVRGTRRTQQPRVRVHSPRGSGPHTDPAKESSRDSKSRHHAEGRLPSTQTSLPPESNICENTKFMACEVPRAAEFYTSKYKIIQEYTEFLISHAKFTDIPISQRYLDISLNHPITHYHHRFRVSFNVCY